MIQITLSFANAAEAQAALAKLSGNAPAATTAPTERTAKAGKVDAPEKKEEPSAPAAEKLDFETVKNKVMAYSKKVDKDTFGKTMAKFKAKSMKDIEANEACWGDVVATCDAVLNG